MNDLFHNQYPNTETFIIIDGLEKGLPPDHPEVQTRLLKFIYSRVDWEYIRNYHIENRANGV